VPEITVTLASLASFPLLSNWLFVEQIDFYKVSEIPHVQFNTSQIDKRGKLASEAKVTVISGTV